MLTVKTKARTEPPLTSSAAISVKRDRDIERNRQTEKQTQADRQTDKQIEKKVRQRETQKT